MREQFHRLQRFLAARLSPTEELGLHFTIGILLMLAAAWVFGDIAEDVVEREEITILDAWLAHWFHARARPAFTSVMLVLTHWHSTAGMLVMTLLLGIYFYARKANYWLLTLLTAVPGGMSLNVLLKHIFRRARPTFEQPLLELATYSFPSGHTVAATLFYGVVACYLVMLPRSWRSRTLVVAAACLMVALVGLSRMYLGVHYLSDVMAAVVEGGGWLAVCVTGVSTLRRRRAARASQ